MLPKNIKGFNLTTLVVIIAIIALLAAVAIPKFINLSRNTQAAGTASVADALSEANDSNYDSRKLNPTAGFPIQNCTDVAKTLEGGLPPKYSIIPVNISPESTITCVLKGPGKSTATFSATGVQ